MGSKRHVVNSGSPKTPKTAEIPTNKRKTQWTEAGLITEVGLILGLDSNTIILQCNSYKLNVWELCIARLLLITSFQSASFVRCENYIIQPDVDHRVMCYKAPKLLVPLKAVNNSSSTGTFSTGPSQQKTWAWDLTEIQSLRESLALTCSRLFPGYENQPRRETFKT